LKSKSIRCPKKTNAIFTTNSDTIIFCTETGLVYYNLINKTYSKANIKIPAADVVKVQCDNNGKLYCLTHDDRIWERRANNWMLITDYSPKYNSEKEFYELDLSKTSKTYNLKHSFNIFNKQRAFDVFYDKVVQFENGNLHIIDLTKDTVVNITFDLRIDIFDIQINHDTILLVCNLRKVNNSYIADFFQISTINNQLVQLPQKRDIITSDLNYGMYPLYLSDLSSSFFTYTDDGYFTHNNEINTKILSYCISESKFYLGTYGSGVIEIDFSKNTRKN
jgi:hypothetical protein